MNLRPTTFDGIIGQVDTIECIRILVKAANIQHNAIPHLLVSGPPGLGKTTIARAIANEINNEILLANGGNIKSAKDILPYLRRLEHGDILFIDEIHRVAVSVQESLFTVMEDYRYDLSKGGRSINFEPFTMIGATTDAGTLLKPFRDRFVMQFTLELYSVRELRRIVDANCAKLQLNLSDHAAEHVASISRGTPRTVNSILTWIQQYCISEQMSNISLDQLKKAVTMIGIDSNGFTKNDGKYIDVLKKSDKAVGINTLVSATNIDKVTIENVIEPFLIRNGIIDKTSRGRVLV